MIDEKTRKAATSSNKQNWRTPPGLFDRLNKEFKFTLDAAADDENHLLPNYFTEEDDGLAQSWAGHTVFVNPPYSDSKKWIKKAYEEAHQLNTTVVMLIPSRTSTRAWADYVMKSSEVRFIKGRLKFVDPDTGEPGAPALFPSCIVVFDGLNDDYPLVSTYER